jgi:tyrosine-protein kinase Etk/Wzc
MTNLYPSVATTTMEPAAAAIDAVVENKRASGPVDEITLLELWAIAAQRKRLILYVTVAAAAVSVVVSLLIPNRYTATTCLLPPQQQQSLAAALASQMGGASLLGAVAGKDLGLKNPNDLYIGMLKSRVVNDALIKRFDLAKVYRDKKMSEVRKDLQSATDIQNGKEGFINVSVEDKDAKRAAEMANAYVEELRSLTSTLATTEAGQRRLFFEQQLRKTKDDLANAEVALKETQQKTGFIQMDSQARAIIGSVAALRAQIAAKEVELRAMQFSSTDQNPDLVMGRQQLAGLQAQLAKLEKQQNSGGGDIQVPTGAIPEAGLEYIRSLRDVKYYEAVFELLAKQLEAANLDEARQGAVIQVVDPAIEPDKKSSPHRSLIVLASIIAAFIGALVWILISETTERTRLFENRSVPANCLANTETEATGC